jgi:hypothetical protein
MTGSCMAASPPSCFCDNSFNLHTMPLAFSLARAWWSRLFFFSKSDYFYF